MVQLGFVRNEGDELFAHAVIVLSLLFVKNHLGILGLPFFIAGDAPLDRGLLTLQLPHHALSRLHLSPLFLKGGIYLFSLVIELRHKGALDKCFHWY